MYYFYEICKEVQCINQYFQVVLYAHDCSCRNKCLLLYTSIIYYNNNYIYACIVTRYDLIIIILKATYNIQEYSYMYIYSFKRGGGFHGTHGQSSRSATAYLSSSVVAAAQRRKNHSGAILGL